MAKAIPAGSTIVFDYPDEHTYTEKAGERTKKTSMLASGAGEAMLASYSHAEMEKRLYDCGFSVHEHLTPDDITKEYFAEYNQANPQYAMKASDNVNYCLAVRR